MNYLEKLFDGVHYVFNINAATLSGAIDIHFTIKIYYLIALYLFDVM